MTVCGLFAFSGTRAPDPTLLAAAAEGAARRGPHGHGWVTDAAAAYGPGPLLTLPDTAATPWILGHSRLATTGTIGPDVTALQPTVRNGHVGVHNGTLDAWAPGTARTDSHALIDTYTTLRAAGWSPAEAHRRALAGYDPEAWALIIRDADGTLTWSRQRLPLFLLAAEPGVYLSSVTFAGAAPWPDSTVGHHEQRMCPCLA